MVSHLSTVEQIWRGLDRPLWIVTAASDFRRGGLVATWFMQASIDPDRPVVSAAIAANHFTRELIAESGGLAAHLIRPDRIDLAWRFGMSSGRDYDKLLGVPHTTGISGSPILDDCLAWLDCRVIGEFSTGDRIYYWADVLDARQLSNSPPLTEQRLIAAATPEQLRQLRQQRQADVEIQRPLFDAWR